MKKTLIFLWQSRMQSLWSTAYFSCWAVFIQNIMEENYFYFAFSTAVVKSSVEPANIHETTQLSRGTAATAPWAQLWAIVAYFAADSRAHRCKWIFLVADPGPVSPVPGLDLLLPPASNSQTLSFLQCPALRTSCD